MEQSYVLKSLEQQLKEFKKLFLNAPNEQIDNTLKHHIKIWSKIPKAIEILHILDYAVRYAAASDFAVSIFEIALNVALENEQLKIQDVYLKAYWRD